MCSMRKASLIFLLAIVVFLLTPTAFATQNVFIRSLSVGSYGLDVMALQKILNSDPATAISGTGPGSKEQETLYFGLKTKQAVIHFQEKYADKILYPNQLTSGTGTVGPSTRAMLVFIQDSKTVVVATSTNPLPLPPQKTATNPNLKRVDNFLSAIDVVAAKNHTSPTEVVAIKNQVMKDIATTTDLQSTFIHMVEQSQKTALSPSSKGFIVSLSNEIVNFFQPQRAKAAAAVPFGGALLFTFYCTQSQTWLITTEPLPPSYPVLLSYVPFTQAFLSYNIPVTPELLGFYEPGAGVCVAGICPYCVTIPNEGMITPETGSAPL